MPDTDHQTESLPPPLHLAGRRPTAVVSTLSQNSFLAFWCLSPPRGDDGLPLCDLLTVYDHAAVLWRIVEIPFVGTDPAAARAVFLEPLADLAHAGLRLSHHDNVADPPHLEHIHRIVLNLATPDLSITVHDRIADASTMIVGASLEVVLKELDTVPDFIDYLNTRAAWCRDHEDFAMPYGETDLVAEYLRAGHSLNHLASPKSATGAWDSLISTLAARQHANHISYAWDTIVTDLRHSDNDDLHDVAGEMTRVDRLGRRLLAMELRSTEELARRNHGRFCRHCSLDGQSFVFLFVPGSMPHDERALELSCRCHIARDRFPDNRRVIGLAAYGDNSAAPQWDAVVLDIGQWNDDDHRQANAMRNQLGAHSTCRLNAATAGEFPADDVGGTDDDQIHDYINQITTARKIGRNDLCPCGSGRKYKRCHGASA